MSAGPTTTLFMLIARWPPVARHEQPRPSQTQQVLSDSVRSQIHQQPTKRDP